MASTGKLLSLTSDQIIFNGQCCNDIINTICNYEIAAIKALDTLLFYVIYVYFGNLNNLSKQKWKLLKCMYAERLIFFVLYNFPVHNNAANKNFMQD